MPDVVVCSADIAALGVMNVFGRAGIHMPEDVAPAGFDDIEAAQYFYPSLTTVRQDKHGIAAAAVRLLLSQINYEPLGEPHVVVPTSVVIRSTTRPRLPLGARLPPSDGTGKRGRTENLEKGTKRQ